MQWDDRTGFLWLATEAGVVRYDGMAFKTFDNTSNPDLGSNRIVFALKNEKNKIFIGGESGNLLVVKDNKVNTFIKDPVGVRYDYNYYCAASASDTLFRKCLKKHWPDHYFTIFGQKVMPINDTACLAWALGNLFYYSITTNDPVLINNLPGNIKNVFKVDNDCYYLDSLNRLFSYEVYRGKSVQQEILDTAGRHFDLKEKNSQVFWEVGMPNPVLIQDGVAWRVQKKDNGRLRLSLIATGIPEDALYRYVQYMQDGNYLFLATDSKGLYIIHKNQLVAKQPTETNINQRNSFYSQVEMPNGNVLTSDGRVIGDNFPKSNYNLKRFDNAVFRPNDSTVIFYSGDTLYSYNRYSYTSKNILVMHTNDVFAALNSGNKMYYVNQKGIGILDGNGGIKFEREFNEQINYNLNPIELVEMPGNKLLLACCAGLLSFDTQTKQLDTLLKIPSVCVRALYKYGNYVFVGTYGGGFYVLKNGKLKAMPPDINQYLKYTHCFIEDDNGFCWISTNNGIFKVKTSDITDAYDKDLTQIYYHYLGKNDGMQTTEMNGGCTPCAIRLRNGNFSFPTMDGLLWFNPAKVDVFLPEGDLYVDRLIADGKLINQEPGKSISFPEMKKLEIVLSTNVWCKKENLYIDFKLNDENWQRTNMASNEPVIALSNLSYGKYILQIRKLNGFGTNNYSYASISFTVATPYYHQWWFRILAVLALGGLVYAVFWLRLRQYEISEKKLSAMVDEKTRDLNIKNIELEKNDQIKTRLISVINHDIITPLKFMHYAGKALIQNTGVINREQELETISDIVQTAKDMEMLSSQILNWIIYQNPNQRMQKEEFDLHQVVELLLGVLQIPAKMKNTLLKNEVPPHFVVYQYMEPLRVLVYNLALNSVNFTRDGTINVSARFEGNMAIIQVKDTGLGMTTGQIENLMSDDRIIPSPNIDNKKGTGLGYMIIKDLLRLMEGKLTVESSKTSGTTVSISLPSVAMY